MRVCVRVCVCVCKGVFVHTMSMHAIPLGARCSQSMCFASNTSVCAQTHTHTPHASIPTHHRTQSHPAVREVGLKLDCIVAKQVNLLSQWREALLHSASLQRLPPPPHTFLVFAIILPMMVFRMWCLFRRSPVVRS